MPAEHTASTIVSWRITSINSDSMLRIFPISGEKSFTHTDKAHLCSFAGVSSDLPRQTFHDDNLEPILDTINLRIYRIFHPLIPMPVSFWQIYFYFRFLFFKYKKAIVVPNKFEFVLLRSNKSTVVSQQTSSSPSVGRK